MMRLPFNFPTLGRVASFLALMGAPALFAAEVDVTKLPPAAQRQVDFVADIQPLLENRCLKCHSGDKPTGKLSNETRAAALKEAVLGALDELSRLPVDQLLNLRYEKFRKLGQVSEG